MGKTLPGGFVILELIATGGMGRVYRAEQTKLGRTVAVKIIHSNLLGDEKAMARFIAEARTASLLNHPNSISIIDFGKTEDGQPYLVMEYLTGRNLADVLEEDWPLPFLRIIDILRQVLAALSEAHHMGIIHRDLKPENIIVQPMRHGGDLVKVVDFGLARVLSQPEQKRITAEGIVCGTPDFMAPEQGRGDEIDGRVDIYAAGVILYQMLTGRLPFEGQSATEVVIKHITEPPIDPRKVAPSRGIPATLAMVTLSALAKDPRDRYQDAQAFSNALLAVRQQLEAPSLGTHTPIPPSDLEDIVCPACGASNHPRQRFCGQCGARLSPSSKPAPKHVSEPRISVEEPQLQAPSSELPLPLPLAGRGELLDALMDHWRRARRQLQVVHLVGDPGFGKTRLLQEFATLLDPGDAIVVRAERDQWWADVALHGARRIVRQLSGIQSGPVQLDSRQGVSRETLEGLNIIYGQTPSSKDPVQIRQAVASALLWSVKKACAHATTVVLCIDDVDRIDGATRNAIWDSLPEMTDLPVMVVATSSPRTRPLFPVPAEEYELPPLSVEEAKRLASGSPFTDWFEHLQPKHLSPLLVGQVRLLSQRYGGEPVFNLPDLIGLRVNMLGPMALRILQVLSLIGAPLDEHQIAMVAGKESLPSEAFAELQINQMAQRQGGKWRVVHPLIREVAQESIPAGARRALHERIASLSKELDLPLEAVAIHAYGAKDMFNALVMLEQVGNRAMQLGDVETATEVYRQGVDMARQALYRGELDEPLEVVLMFSEKLANAMSELGDENGAEGVLREAAALAEPRGQRTATILYHLAEHLVRKRHHLEEAIRVVQTALEAARSSGSDAMVQDLIEWQRRLTEEQETG